jgi:hypothetical protein
MRVALCIFLVIPKAQCEDLVRLGVRNENDLIHEARHHLWNLIFPCSVPKAKDFSNSSTPAKTGFASIQHIPDTYSSRRVSGFCGIASKTGSMAFVYPGRD